MITIDAPTLSQPTHLEELAPGITILADLLGDRVVYAQGNHYLEHAYHCLWARAEGRLTRSRAELAEERLRARVERALRVRAAKTMLERASELVSALRAAPYRADHVLEVHTDAMDCGHLGQMFVNDWQASVSVGGMSTFGSGPTRESCLDRLESQVDALFRRRR